MTTGLPYIMHVICSCFDGNLTTECRSTPTASPPPSGNGAHYLTKTYVSRFPTACVKLEQLQRACSCRCSHAAPCRQLAAFAKRARIHLYNAQRCAMVRCLRQAPHTICITRCLSPRTSQDQFLLPVFFRLFEVEHHHSVSPAVTTRHSSTGRTTWQPCAHCKHIQRLAHDAA